MVMTTPALREDRGFPLIPKTYLLIFTIFAQWGGVREDRTPLFFKPTDIRSIGFLRFRLFFRMIY